MPKKIKVLLVEDNEDERLFMKNGFVQSGLYEVIGEAENGNDLLEFLSTSNSFLPDVILSDLNMPGRNGYEVILDIKTNRTFAHIPVIILTTAPFKPYEKRCKELGACAYYTKPDTFLEYKEFAENIYEDVSACISKIDLEYSSVKQAKGGIVQNLRSLTRLFSAPFNVILSSK